VPSAVGLGKAVLVASLGDQLKREVLGDLRDMHVRRADGRLTSSATSVTSGNDVAGPQLVTVDDESLLQPGAHLVLAVADGLRIDVARSVLEQGGRVLYGRTLFCETPGRGNDPGGPRVHLGRPTQTPRPR